MQSGAVDKPPLSLRITVLVAFWVIFFLGAYATVFDLLEGKVEGWMAFFVMWIIVTGLVTNIA